MAGDAQWLEPQNSPDRQVAALRKSQAQGQLMQAQAQKAQMQVQQMEAVKNLMRDAAQKGGMSPSSVPGMSGPNDLGGPAMFAADISMRAGDLAGAMKYLSAAATIKSKEAYQRHQEVVSMKEQGAMEKARLQEAVGLLGMVHDDQSLDTANRMYQAKYGQPSPLAGQKYNKEMVDDLMKSVNTAKDNLELQLKERTADRNDANVESQIEFRDFRKRLMEREQNLRKAREGRIGKVGGKAIGSPTTSETDHAYQLVAKSMPDLDYDEQQDKAYAVAAQAKALRLAHPGLTADDAIRQAMQKVSRSPGVTFQDGKTPSNALALPPDGKFEAGKYYNTRMGVLQFNGTGFTKEENPEDMNDPSDDETPPED